MGNGHPQLKAAADYVTAPIGEDGVYKACEKRCTCFRGDYWKWLRSREQKENQSLQNEKEYKHYGIIL